MFNIKNINAKYATYVPYIEHYVRYQLNAARHTVTVTSEMSVENRMVLDVTAASRR